MHNYTYAASSLVAILVHLIFNYNLMFRGKFETHHGIRYRRFLFGMLVFFVTDAAWGVFAGLGWIAPWYVDTLFYFISLSVVVFLWSRFVSEYLGFGKAPSRCLARRWRITRQAARERQAYLAGLLPPRPLRPPRKPPPRAFL